MKYFSYIVLSFLITFSAFGQESSGNKDVDVVVSEGNIFALQLYNVLAADKENTVFSPFAVSESLALLYYGADGSTESQTARVIRFKSSKSTLSKSYMWLNEHLNDTAYFFAASLWVQRGVLNTRFQGTIEKDFRATLKSVDFITRADSIRSDMNNWVRERTQGKITDLVALKELSNLTRMVALSGAYVKGRWEQTFDPRNTKQAPFFRDRYITSTVPTMFAVGDYNYLDEQKFSMVELPYDSRKASAGKLALIVILPHDTHGLKSVESMISADKLKSWMSSMQKKRVLLSMPRFRVVDTFSLESALAKVGLVDAFTDSANFLDIHENGDLKLSKVFHKSMYSVDEWGSEGGLPSGGGGELQGSSQMNVTFKADHPFMFIVVDRSNGAILLLGHVTSP